MDSGENHTESENPVSSDECKRTSETTRFHVQKEQMGQVHSSKRCRVTRHDTGGLQEYLNKESATGGNQAVTQKKKSSELPKRDLEGSEVQKIGRPRTGTRTWLMSSR